MEKDDEDFSEIKIDNPIEDDENQVAGQTNPEPNDEPGAESEPKPDKEPEAKMPIMADLGPSLASKPKKKVFKKIIFVLVLLIAMSAGAFAIWYFAFNGATVVKDIINGKTVVTEKTANEKLLDLNPNLAKMIAPTTGEKWLDNLVKIDPQGYFKNEADYYVKYGSIQYYDAGTRGDRSIILANITEESSSFYIFEKAADSTVQYIIHPNGLATYNETVESYIYEGKMFTDNVAVNKDIHYDSLSIPDKIQVDTKGSIVSLPTTNTLGTSYSAPNSSSTETVELTIGKSRLLKIESTNVNTDLVSMRYGIVTPFNSIINLKYEPINMSLSNYRWVRGYPAGDVSLKAVTKGCGAIAASATLSNTLSDDDLVYAGKTPEGLMVYDIKDINNPLVRVIYNEYSSLTGTYSGQVNYIVPIQSFVDGHSIIIYKDLNGQFLVYVRTDRAPETGCGKPVIYLYPQVEQQVSVKVGADVKISDPLYDIKNGWTTIAKPNGQLSVNGSTYSSLFWEGIGYGQYPDITVGTIVKRQDAVRTIRQQLAQQGLIATEINDFMSYWEAKIPNDPYIRLTWLDTAQMNQLAPLSVSPKPDTIIRVFLDMSGLNKIVKIPKQDLKSIPRVGFTLVEWGGLITQKF